MPILLALGIYAAAVLAIGAVAARSASSSWGAFLLGGRGFGTAASWAALSSTTIGGSTTLVLAALVGTAGTAALWLDLAGAAGLAALGLFLARRVRATGAATIAEVIGGLYGGGVRKVAALLVVLAEIVWFALLTEATGTVVTAATDWPPRLVLVASAAVFIAYTAFGGQRAVIRTDAFQFGLMAILLIGVALPLAVASLLKTGLPVAHLTFPFGPRLGPADAAALFVLVGLPHAVGSDVWAKVLSARDEGVARRAVLGAAASKLVFGLATVTIALAGIAAGESAGVTLFPRTVLDLAGPVAAPLLFVAMIATMQSSSDSVLLSAAAATGHDLFPGLRRPGIGRLLVVIHGALGLGVALWMRSLLETFRLGYTIFASGLILPILVGMSRRWRVQPVLAGAAMVLGGGTAVACHFIPFAHSGPFDPVLIGTAVNAAILAVGLRRVRPA